MNRYTIIAGILASSLLGATSVALFFAGRATSRVDAESITINVESYVPVSAEPASEVGPMGAAIELAPIRITSDRARPKTTAKPAANDCGFDYRPLVQGSGEVRGFCP